uniref:Craniofacial development protein 2 n=1 Tax=Schistocephalus solidus TaxID=70667 RepID=A0A0X3NVN9_SCHSO
MKPGCQFRYRPSRFLCEYRPLQAPCCCAASVLHRQLLTRKGDRTTGFLRHRGVPHVAFCVQMRGELSGVRERGHGQTRGRYQFRHHASICYCEPSCGNLNQLECSRSDSLYEHRLNTMSLDVCGGVGSACS